MIYANVEHNFTIDNNTPQFYKWEANARQFLRFNQILPIIHNETCIVNEEPIVPSNSIFNSTSNYSI